MNDVQYSYDSLSGRLSEVRDGSGRQRFYYDALGNVSRNVRTFALPYSGHTYTFSMEYEYDSWGRMMSMAYPDGEVVEYGYDLGGSLNLMSGTKDGTPYRYINSILYDRFGNRSLVEYGNLCHSEYTYDDLQRLTGVRAYAYNNGIPSLVQDIAYTFDGVGNITCAANGAPPFGTLGGPYTNTYRYDGIDRLTDATQSYGTGSVLSASYSPSGRLCGRTQSFSGQEAVYGYDRNDKPHAPRRIADFRSRLLHDLRWNKQGCLEQVNTHDVQDGSFVSSRHLCWTEDSRLASVVDDRHFSYYAYDHSGERVVKLTGQNSLLDVNADIVNCNAVVYSNANEGRWGSHARYSSTRATGSCTTKHYYAGTERVCARMGNGGLNHWGGFIGDNMDIVRVVQSLFDSTLSRMSKRILIPNNPSHVTAECGNAPAQQTALLAMPLEPVPTRIKAKAIVSTDRFNSSMTQYAALTQQNEDAYFYHSDHLGSASWVTDGDGIPVQHLQYLPFGEPFVNQRASGSTYNERYTFTGKERDSETGYSYFGARFYDSDLSGLFLSVDPMADKYPSISPYAYCAWNPIKIIDSDGKDGRVVVHGRPDGTKSITINTTVYLKSDVLNKKELTLLANNAQFEAKRMLKTKHFDNYEVSFNIQYKVYDGEELAEGDNLLIVDPNNTNTSGVKGKKETFGGIVVGGLAGNVGNINSDITSSIGGSKGKGILHETLHFLGLTDKYSGDHSFKGFEKDIMGVDARNAKRINDSHYMSFIKKYGDSEMLGNPYILLKERIDVLETESLKRKDETR